MMENLKNSPGKGPQASYLRREDREIFMSPQYFSEMDEVSKGLQNRLRLRGDGLAGARDRDFERSYKSLKYSRQKNDVWSLGATILYAGNLESIRPMYNDYKRNVDPAVLETMLGKFEKRYGNSQIDAAGAPQLGQTNANLVGTVKSMLQIDEGDRPTFSQLKAKICPDIELHDTFDDAEFNPDVDDPFKDMDGPLGEDNYHERQKPMSYRQMEHMMMNRIAEHPEYGGVFGLQNGYRGRRKQGHLGIGHNSIQQGKVMQSMEFVNQRNNDLFRRNYNFVPTYGDYGDTNQPAKVDGDGIINRRYFA
jgi:serine/threonine protein kinase